MIPTEAEGAVVKAWAHQALYDLVREHFKVFLQHNETRRVAYLLRPMMSVREEHQRLLAQWAGEPEGEVLKEWSAFCELGGRSRSSLNEHVEQGAGVPVLLQRLVRFSHRFDPGVHEGPEGTTAWELPTVMRGRRVVDWATLGGGGQADPVGCPFEVLGGCTDHRLRTL